MLGLRSCLGFSLVVASGGYSPVVMLRFLIAMACLISEHVSRVHRLGSCSSRDLEHRLNSYLSGSEIEPVSPALADGFFTSEPPWKPHLLNVSRCTKEIKTSYTEKFKNLF